MGEESVVYGHNGYRRAIGGKTRLHGISKVGKSGIRPTAGRPKARAALFACMGKSGVGSMKNHLIVRQDGARLLRSQGLIPRPNNPIPRTAKANC